MRLLFTPGASEDFAYWRTSNPALARKIRQILCQLQQGAPLSPHQVTPLTIKFPQLTSVKITPEHRIVFEQVGADIVVHQCRYHY